MIRLARLYPSDFSEMELMVLEDQLETYILDMQTPIDFSNLGGIGDLAKKMVETRRDKCGFKIQARTQNIKKKYKDRNGFFFDDTIY